MASESSSTRTVVRWNKLRGSGPTIVFLILAIIAEILVVLYAMALGVSDVGAWTTRWPVTITFSPLFELVPIVVVITLFCSWIYLAKQLSFRPIQQAGKPEVRQPFKRGRPTKREIEKAKPSQETPKVSVSIWQKMGFTKTTTKSAVIILIAFAVLVLLISQLVFPAALYQAVASSYQSHSAFYGFVTTVAKDLAGFARAIGLGGVGAALSNAAPSIRAIGSALGSLIAPLANLDAAGKYLAFQNVAACISVLLVLLYTYYPRRTPRFQRK